MSVTKETSKVLIVGATSWLAGHFLRLAPEENHQFLLVSRSQENIDGYEVITGDCTDYTFVIKTLRQTQPDLVVNFAGVSLPDEHFSQMMAVNYGISANFLRAITELGLETRLTVIGSAAEYGKPERDRVKETDSCSPISAYGFSKWMQSNLLEGWTSSHDNGPILQVARVFNLWGEGAPAGTLGAVLSEKVATADNSLVKLHFPNMERDFIHVEEAARQIWEIIDSAQLGIFNVCSGQAMKLSSFCQMIAKQKGDEQLEVIQEPGFENRVQPLPIVVGSREKFADL